MRKGFTLIELLVVVLIIGILSAVALPQYQKSVDKSYTAELSVAVAEMKRSMQLYYLANSEWNSHPEELDLNYNLTNCRDKGAVRICGITKRIHIEGGNIDWTIRMSSPYEVGIYGMRDREIQCVAAKGSSRADNVCKMLSGKAAPTGTAGNGANVYDMK
ncbi:type IV pilin protein [Candidatus Avelusimicrobium sp.]